MTNNDLRNNIKQIKIEEDDPAKRRKLAENDRWKAKPHKTSYIYVSAYGVCDSVFEFSNKYSFFPKKTRDYMFYAFVDIKSEKEKKNRVIE
jgi:hypothetical protein